MKTEKALEIIRGIPNRSSRRTRRWRSSMTSRGGKIRKFVRGRGLEVTGFRKAMKKLVAEFIPAEDVEYEFGEWFGDIKIIPAAFKIERCGDGVWDTIVHVYEVEDSNQISKDRIADYGRIADGCGPLITLHIIDRFGEEHILTNSMVECFVFYEHHREEEYTDAILRNARSAKELPKGERSLKWKAAYDALREMGIEI